MHPEVKICAHISGRTMRLLKLYLLTAVVTVYLVIPGCSSSSYSNRYNKAEETETPERSKVNRFSSEDDPEPSKESTSTTYSNPSGSTEFDETPVEDHPVDKAAFVKNYKYLEQISSSLTSREKMLFEIVSYLETPYQYGGNGINGIDCSAFTKNIFQSSAGINLPRTASEQYGVGSSINRSSLKFGDLVFFNTTRKSYPGHVGIFIGNDMFAHASSSLGVTISSLKSTYFNSRYIGGKRIDDISGQ